MRSSILSSASIHRLSIYSMRSNHSRLLQAPAAALAAGLLTGLAGFGVAASYPALASGILTPTAPIPNVPATTPPVTTPPAIGSPAAVLQADPPPAPPAASPAPAGAPVAPQAAPVSNSRILLALGKREIRLERDGKVYGPWPVAIGDPATPTPTGTFNVTNKVINPQYVSTSSGQKKGVLGPNGPLGDRWIGFKTKGPNQFGIHGTPNAWAWTVSSRAAVTNGCVRMFHEHVRKLFEMVEVGTPVVVVR
ncbi:MULTISPECIES: L,D-transpeptidase [unclassified Synechococcus]|uniref:L,D-transpeptidase n=1 Tax=unclassified Synechococcus TaxID=2626047 RepID=UPI0020CDA496|nr:MULTISPECIES: L,D-transpeptidase [unclassified Synechococcus]